MNNKVEIFNHEQFGKTKVKMVDEEVYFLGNDITKLLGYKNSRKALKDHCKRVVQLEVPHPQSQTKTLLMNFIPENDVISLITNSNLLTQSEKQEILVAFDLDDKIILQSRKEIEFGEQLMLFMYQLNYKIETQYKILEYYIDFYIPELNIAIEYDEEQHKHSYEEDKQREIEIQEEIGCKFIRIDDGLNIGTQLGMIMKYIMEER